MTKTELTLEAAKRAISFLPPDDRDMWVKIGMALKDEFGDGARDAWFDWSSGAKDYNEQSATHVWKSIKASGKVTIGSLIYEAKQFGWRAEAADKVRVTPEEYARKQAERERRRAAEDEQNKLKAERAAQRARQLWDSAEPATEHPYLTRKGIQPHGTRILPIWERKHTDEETGEITTVSVLNVLLIPIYCGPNSICSVQAVFPERNDVLARDKDYLPGGAKQGGYFTLGAITRATLRIVLCEGFATGCSIHEATNLTTVVCFDAGNLLAVADAIRAKLPDVEIIIAGDNDLWTKGNPGARKANAAAMSVHGRVSLPIFADYEGEPTDFNDLRDPEEIRSQILAASDPIDPDTYQPDCRWISPSVGSEPQPAVGNAGADEPPQENSGSTGSVSSFFPTDGAVPQTPPTSAPTGVGGEHDCSPYFEIRGYDHDKYYVFQHERKQLAVYSAGSFTDGGFIALAPLDWWDMEFPSKSGFVKKMAMNWFIRTAHEKGIFDPSMTRGRGAWVDRGRVILHIGNMLYVDGVPTPITSLQNSRYVYELDRSMPKIINESLTSEEGEELLALAMRFRWTKPASAPMLIGWCALAPLCGALRWRPHIWLTGGAGTGKSWILNYVVHPLMNGMAVFAQGNSTEAGIRQTLRQDALPVLFDESEKNNDKEKQRVDGVLALIRQASTESAARTLKGTATGDAQHFHIRSMFCLASVLVGMEHQADYERMAVLALRPKREGDDTSSERWKETQEIVYRLIERDETLPARLFRRSLDLLPTTLQNIEVFSTAAAVKFGSQRDGDQYGTLMAGAWSLISDRVATQAEAMAMLDSYDWGEYIEHTDSDDSMKALGALMSAQVRVNGGNMVSIHDLIMLANLYPISGISNDLAGPTAIAILGRYGIKIVASEIVFVTSCTTLAELVSNTPFAADLKGLLLRIKGSRRFPKPIWVNGITSRGIAVPLAPLLPDEKPPESCGGNDANRPF